MNQRSILLAYLPKNGRTSCADLERFCDVRSVTTRMAELIRKGAPIVKSRVIEPNTRGKPGPPLITRWPVIRLNVTCFKALNDKNQHPFRKKTQARKAL